MAVIKQGVLLLSSGRHVVIPVDNIIIHSDLQVTTGVWSDFFSRNKSKVDGEKICDVANPHNLTIEEMFELIDYMMVLWMRLKENIRTYGMTDAQVFEINTEAVVKTDNNSL